MRNHIQKNWFNSDRQIFSRIMETLDHVTLFYVNRKIRHWFVRLTGLVFDTYYNGKTKTYDKKLKWNSYAWLNFHWEKQENVWDSNLSKWIDVDMRFTYTWKQPFSLKKDYWHSVYRGKREFGYCGIYKKYIWQNHWVRQDHFVNDMDAIFDPYEDYLESGGHNE